MTRLLVAFVAFLTMGVASADTLAPPPWRLTVTIDGMVWHERIVHDRDACEAAGLARVLELAASSDRLRATFRVRCVHDWTGGVA